MHGCAIARARAHVWPFLRYVRARARGAAFLFPRRAPRAYFWWEMVIVIVSIARAFSICARGACTNVGDARARAATRACEWSSVVCGICVGARA